MDANSTTDLIQAVAALTAVSRLICLNLSKRFPSLLAYLVFLAAINFGFGLLSVTSAAYFWSYIVVEPLKCTFSILAVRELFALTFHDYPGIRSLSRWVMYAGVALALGISLFLTSFFWSGAASGRAHSHIFYLDATQRSIISTLAVVIVANLVFLSRYPLHLSRSTLVSSTFFSVVFLSEALRILVDSLAPHLFNLYADWAESVFVSVSLLGWAALLKREPERAALQARYSRSQEDHLLLQLNSLNQLMTRAARR